MKTLKIILAILTFISISSCSKNDEPTITPVVDTKLALPTILSNDTMFPIPDATGPNNGLASCGIDAQPGSVVSEIVIVKDGIIKDASKVTVEIDLEHLYISEIVIELIAPNGESCGLLKRAYAAGDNSCTNPTKLKYKIGNKLSFNSLFTGDFSLLVAPGNVPTGNYKPIGPSLGTYPVAILMTPLNTFFTTKNIKGIWKLKAYDCSKGDIGKLNSWKIKFDTGALE